MAAKKPVKKVLKAAQKTSKPVAGSHAAPKLADKKPVKKVAPKKAEPKKTAVKPPAAKAANKPAAIKPVASKSTGSKVASKKAPAHAVAKKPAARTAVASTPAAAKPSGSKSSAGRIPTDKSPGRDASAGSIKVNVPKQPQASHHSASPVAKPASKPVAKPVAREHAQRATTAVKPTIAPRPVGKVAVAVAAKPTPAPRKDKIKTVPYKTDESTGRPILPPNYKPSSDEEYMGILQVEYFRQRLQSWRVDLVEESKQTIENLKDEVRDVGDEAERATRETENSLELRTRDRYRKLIGKIDSTLKRLDSGEYGYSVDSGEDIGLERLEARLTAERTIDEQERWEHLQKQIGD